MSTAALCNDFEWLAARTWGFLGAAEQAEVRMGEETLTDVNLVDLQIRHPTALVTRKFARYEEARNAADWEWWLLQDGRAVGLRMQAKKLYWRDCYPALRGTGRAQADVLVRRAVRDGVAPLYCFYNFHPDPSVWPAVAAAAIPIEQMGCAVSSGWAVRQAVFQTGSCKLDALAPLQRPWRSLVCASSARGARGAAPALRSVRSALAELFDGDGGGTVPELRAEADLPAYARAARERQLELDVPPGDLPVRRVAIVVVDEL